MQEAMESRSGQLCARDDELAAVIERARAERQAVHAEMASVKDELDSLVSAPVSGGHDLTLWLPDELMEMIFLMVPFEALWDGVCERVCRRWGRIARESILVTRRKQDERWVAYEAGIISPRRLEGHKAGVSALAVGQDGKIYSASYDHTIRVWSGVDGTYLQTLKGHTSPVVALAVGLDGKIYSADMTIRVWSGVSGTHLRKLEGHTDLVVALAVGLDGKIYSGSCDTTIRAWSGVHGAHLQTLEGHTDSVLSLAVGLDGKIYSGSNDRTIRAWSGVDGAHLQTLEGHTSTVIALAVGPDGKIYSGSGDHTIRVDGKHLQTQLTAVTVLAVGPDGNLYSGSWRGLFIRVW